MSESERPGEPTTHEQETDVRDSTPNSAGPDRAEGGMGVSSERVGPTGPGQVSTDGVRPTHPEERDPDAEVPPEQSTGNPEPQPEGLEPRAGYSSKDPRSG
ncbi:hypothetical protein [Nocardioides ungokensis]|uniref:hypothetical protein n=1 Tax=Nocardioides ungokensis TaxID=1643322 RepID=UPI0015DD6B63|nr:hypothetical protein [Nocardioides ungokensis]